MTVPASPTAIAELTLLACQPPIVAWASVPTPSPLKLVILDDDPTGTQTVVGVPVLTEWSVDSLVRELRGLSRGFFILTNSRALPAGAARLRASEIGASLREACRVAGCAVNIISRSDSTLRGHFPDETEALAEGLGIFFDATVLVPAFLAGGRLTVDDVHYVREGAQLVPVGETEFARDAAFGFRHSNLCGYIEEKYHGRIRSGDVLSISLGDLRIKGAAHVAQKLASLTEGGVAIVNAADRTDLHVLTAALADRALHGHRLLFRTAADFAAAWLGQVPQPPLATTLLRGGPGPRRGLVVAGSYVGKTSRQLQQLFQDCPGLVTVECDAARVAHSDSSPAEIERCRTEINRAFRQGLSVCLYTSRRLLTTSSPADSLRVGSTVSRALVDIVRGLDTRPDWLVAKGGITSSDLATAALDIRCAIVLGQALPGVPVWQCGAESRWPGLPYIVFPGNVGGDHSLSTLVHNLLEI